MEGKGYTKHMKGEDKMKYVIKRDGRKVPYNREKIVIALSKANKEVEAKDKISRADIAGITAYIESLDLCAIDIEQIQDIIEEKLMVNGKYRLAKSYILYREKHSIVRQANTTDASILSLVQGENTDLKVENSNKRIELLSTQRDYIAGETSKDLTDRMLLPQRIVDAHKNGVLHFHDRDYFLQKGMINCCLINIKDMLDNGTVINGKLIETPKSFQTACTVVTQIIATIASNQYGGQSVDISHLGKYLRKTYDKEYKHYVEIGKEDIAAELAEDRMRRELKAGIQTIQYQINTLFTTNGQTPFVTIFLYLKEDEYTNENALIIEEMLNQRIKGLQNEQGVYITPAFPKLVYVLDENNCLNGGKYDYLTRLAIKCTAKRMYPDYISAKKMRENYEGNVFSPMGCRSFLSPWKDSDGNFKFEGRFNQGVVTINLPQIGIIANGDEDSFWKILDERLELCYDALMCRHNSLLGTKAKSSPSHWMYGGLARLDQDDTIDEYLNSYYSTLSLGYIGVYETTLLMTGESHTSEKGKEFAMRLMRYLRGMCDKWKKDTGLGFALYGTPAESLAYRFAKIDRETFGDIPNVTDKDYYTNSFHVCVREEIDAFSKFAFEAEFQKLSSGGTISYCEIPNMQHNLDAIAAVVKFIYDNIQYAEFNTKSDYCHVCGFDGEIIVNDDNEWECPICGNKDHSKMNVTRRTCGYLGSQFWNLGKTKEIKERVCHL